MQHQIETIRLGASGILIEREYRGRNEHKLTFTIETPQDRTLFGDLVSAAPDATLKDILLSMGEDAPYLDNTEARLNRELGRMTELAQLVRDYYAEGEG